MKKILALCGILALLTLAGCKGGGSINPQDSSYTLSGLAELNLDDNTDYLYLEFLSEGKAVVGSYMVIDGDTLAFDAAGVVSVSSPTVSWGFGETIQITVHDPAADFSQLVSATMPGNFQVTYFVPVNRIYLGGNVQVEWTGSFGASGIFVTCVARDDNSRARGFAENVGDGLTQITIEQATFEDPVNLTDPRVPDSFYVYLVAYNPTYYGRPGAKYLDTDQTINLGFANSMTGREISGRFGAAVVIPREELYVPEEP